MDNKGLTLSIIFEAESANYGEGVGNVTALKKISRGDHETYTYISRQALHCAKVSFIHPITGEELKFKSDFPKDMRSLILKCCLKINK